MSHLLTENTADRFVYNKHSDVKILRKDEYIRIEAGDPYGTVRKLTK